MIYIDILLINDLFINSTETTPTRPAGRFFTTVSQPLQEELFFHVYVCWITQSSVCLRVNLSQYLINMRICIDFYSVD